MRRRLPAVSVHDAARLGTLAVDVVVIQAEVVAHLVRDRRRHRPHQRVVVLRHQNNQHTNDSTLTHTYVKIECFKD